jgi:hypothetical protein
LQSYDPQARDTGRERRFLCLHCGDSKPRDNAHRSLCVNTQTGAWNCKRCHQTGKLSDFWTDRPVSNGRERARLSFRRKLELPPAPPPPTFDNTWREQLKSVIGLQSTLGVDYLIGRGLSLELAHRARVRFSPAWAPRRADGKAYRGGAAIIFPLTDATGALVATQGRYITPDATPKTRSTDGARLGVYATPGAWESETIVLCEAPFDALSLASIGVPAIATIGCTLPDWVPRKCAMRRVLLATDADEAGDRAALEWEPMLAMAGAPCERMRPDGCPLAGGCKDWNEVLCTLGRDALNDVVVPRVRMDAATFAKVAAWDDEDIFDGECDCPVCTSAMTAC